MKFKILVLSETLERSKKLLYQFYLANMNNVESAESAYEDICRGRLSFKDGTVLYGKSLTQRTERFKGIHFDQVFTDLSIDEIPVTMLQFIDQELMFSEIPSELQWTRLCPDYLVCYDCSSRRRRLY